MAVPDRSQFPHDDNDEDLAHQPRCPHILQLRQRLDNDGGTEQQGQQRKEGQRFQAGEVHLLHGDPSCSSESVPTDESAERCERYEGKAEQPPGVDEEGLRELSQRL